MVNLLCTLVINHAHMDVQNMITATEPTVIITELPNAAKKFVFSIPFTKFVIPKKERSSGNAKGLFIINPFFFNELISTKKSDTDKIQLKC